jgi:shikimate dehydrogenase
MGRFVLFGHPIQHSMSPAIHAAAYRELGLDHRYELVDVPNETALQGAVRSLRAGDFSGANVTVPWKLEAFRLADRKAETALSVGAANVLERTQAGTIVAHNTDVPALAEELSGAAPSLRHVVVIGNGGAALAAVAASRALGAKDVVACARRFVSGMPSTSWPNAEALLTLGARLLPWPDETLHPGPFEFHAACRHADVIIQATSSGMHGAESGESVTRIVPWSELGSNVFVYDLVYNPPETEFLRAARERKLPHAHGLGMLVVQATLAIELWLGTRPPREPLYRAALSALEQRIAK